MKHTELTDLLIEHNYKFVTGVPDSVFKDFLIDLQSRKDFQHIICSNEGEACSLAAGYHLGTGKAGVVYLQNSGLGNCVNPLTSLLDSLAYAIPVLLFITWRGHPEDKDEPQHLRMGLILPQLLEQLAIPYRIATKNTADMTGFLQEARCHFEAHSTPFAIVFPQKIFEAAPKKEKAIPLETPQFTREDALSTIVDLLDDNTVIVTTTGKTSRELFEIREKKNQPHSHDFLTVGSMGCASAIAAGIALAQPQRKIVVIDGDGACLMRLESLPLIGHYQLKQFLHIIIDNNAYESTGSQKTLSDTVDFAKIAQACQYKSAAKVFDKEGLIAEVSNFKEGPKLLSVKVENYSRENLGRPTTTTLENKKQLMDFLNNNKG